MWYDFTACPAFILFKLRKSNAKYFKVIMIKPAFVYCILNSVSNKNYLIQHYNIIYSLKCSCSSSYVAKILMF
jgi:hypothetical protein